MSEIMIAVSSTRDLFMPSSRIRVFIAASTRSVELAGTTGDAVDCAGAVPVAQAAMPMRDAANSVGRKRGARGQRCIVGFVKSGCPTRMQTRIKRVGIRRSKEAGPEGESVVEQRCANPASTRV